MYKSLTYLLYINKTLWIKLSDFVGFSYVCLWIFNTLICFALYSETLIPASLIHSLPSLHSHCFLFLLLAALGSAGLRLGAQALCIRANLDNKTWSIYERREVKGDSQIFCLHIHQLVYQISKISNIFLPLYYIPWLERVPNWPGHWLISNWTRRSILGSNCMTLILML